MTFAWHGGGEMSDSGALVQVWGKGFRVSQHTEEFQLLVPADAERLEEHELRVDPTKWGSVLKALYRLDESIFERQFFIQLSAGSVGFLAVGPTRDRNGRLSAIAVASSSPLDWGDHDLAQRIARLASLSRRILRQAQSDLDGAPEGMRSTLRDGTYLGERLFPLGAEDADLSIDWQAVAHEVSRWKGIAALSTPYLAGLGANVLVGTRHEGERLARIAGVIEPPAWKMVPLGPGIELWPQAVEPQQEVVEVKTEAEHLADISATLRAMHADQRDWQQKYEKDQSRLAAVLDVVSNWFGLWADSKKKKRKK